MNGRMYDYNNGRFLSVDPLIQDPTSTQAINPYSYLGNNPLSGTDPTGYAKCNAGQSCRITKVERVKAPGSHIKSATKFSGVNTETGKSFSFSLDSAGQSFGVSGINSISLNGKELFSIKGADKNPGQGVSNIGNKPDSDFSIVDILKDAVVGAYDQATDETSQLIAKTIISAVDPREDVKDAKNCVFGDGSCLGTAADIISRKLDAVVSVFKIIKKSGVCCFVAGTQVSTKDGLKNIEDVKLAELVWAKNVETGESDWKPVSKIYVEHDRGIYHIRLRKSDGNIINIEATDDHPFYVVNHGWKTTVELQVGDKVETKEIGNVMVVSVEDEHREDTTYNFEIADFHTYYVTEFGVLVHNCTKIFNQHNDAINKVLNNLDYVNRKGVNLKIVGGTEGAIKHTRTTGQLVGGSDHVQKGGDALNRLRKIKNRVKNSQSLTNAERDSLMSVLNQRIDGLVDAFK
jgi:hypothetical protein